MKKVLSLIGALVVAACTYHTPVSFAPSFNVGEAPDQQIEGRYVLVIDRGVAKLSRNIRGRGLSCSAHAFSVDIGTITSDAVNETLGQVFEDIRVAATAPTRDEMREQDIVGVITVWVDRFAPWLSFRDGTSSSALTNLDVSLSVDGVSGPLFATSVTTARRGEAEPGAACEDAATALARSVEMAIQDALTRLVNQLVESEELRQASTRL